METAKLHGQLDDGLFQAERLLTFTDCTGKEVAVVVPASRLTPTGEHRGTITVRLLGSKGDLWLVELPGEVHGAGREVTVRGSQLQEAPA
ncbi:MAG: hypothetical protein WD557_13410 [Dehalococcoidia bacterium]